MKRLKLVLKLIDFYIRFFLFRIVDKIAFKKKTAVNEKSILLIRIDAIGDYILFRNFIEAIRYEKIGYKFFLLGNILWKDIAKTLDASYIDYFIWIDRHKFHNNLIYRFKKLREIGSKDYNIVINPTYSREFFYSDWIVNFVKAEKKIGSIGGYSNIKKWQKKISDRYYTKLIPAKDEVTFEFYRNKEFFENFLNKTINIVKPCIEQEKINFQIDLPKKYVVIFPGGSGKFKKWPIERFALIAKYIIHKYGFNIIVAGGMSEEEDVNKLIKMLPQTKILNLAGKISITEFAGVIRSSALLISNDTMAPHFAVALGCKCIVIYNGKYFGRFVPYPKEITQNYYAIYHPFIKKNLEEYKVLSNNYRFDGRLNIKEITAEDIIKGIDDVFRK